MKNLFTLLLVISACIAQAQTPAGTAFRIDYDEFQDNGDIKYLDCGNNEMLNPGDEMTMMAWVQFRDLNDNQKICGKFNLDDTGFVMGVNQGRIYCEAWNPTFYEALDGLMNPTAEFWYHLSMTFKGGDAMRTFVNGVEVGTQNVGANGLATSDNPFVIGVSPWADFNSFQSFGNMDEMSFFNVALTAEEIKAQMFKGIVGDENGIIAAWNFDTASADLAPDVSGNGNDGTGNSGFSGSEWVASTAVIADANTESAQELTAIWNGLTFTDPRFTTATHGMNLVGSDLTNIDYVVFGHDGGSDVTNADIPTNASAAFMRSGRIWPVTDQSVTPVNVLMNLAQVAGGGAELDGTYPAENYTLLYRAADGTTFSSAANGSSISSGVVSFNEVSLQSGDYAIGVGNGVVDSVNDHDNVAASVGIFPNPTTGEFVITWDATIAAKPQYTITDIAGRQIELQHATTTTSLGRQTLDLSSEPAGIYIVSINLNGVWFNERITKK